MTLHKYAEKNKKKRYYHLNVNNNNTFSIPYRIIDRKSGLHIYKNVNGIITPLKDFI